MRGEATPAQIGGFLVALRLKGETADEIAGCAEAMRGHVLAVRPQRDDLVDTAGTGGDGASTINISTAAAIVAAAAGAGVAKHGNRAVSSASGSADVLEALGFALEQPAARIEQSIDELGFGFMFAPSHHPAMRHAAPVRRELATRTVFNVLGPLTNPAGARAQVIGVYMPSLVRTIAEVLVQLGARRAFVVHGAHGIDELSPAGPNHVCEVVDGEVRERVIDPRRARDPALRPGRAPRRLAGRERAGDPRRPRRRGRRQARRDPPERGGRDRRRRPRRRPARGPRARPRGGRLRRRRRAARRAGEVLRQCGFGTPSPLRASARSPSSSGARPRRRHPPGRRPGGARRGLRARRRRGDLRARRRALRRRLGRPARRPGERTLPLLAKGFFSTDEHLRTAKEAGADAVLLLLRDLDDGQTATLMALAAELGLDTLVEAHDAAELERAIALGAP